MKKIFFAITILAFNIASFAQGFKVTSSGIKTFDFTDMGKRNQASFYSTTPLEDITGLTNDVSGKVNFDISNIKSIRGEFSVSIASIKTGIDLRDEHLRDENWLDAAKFPNIKFKINKVTDVKQLADNKLQVNFIGDFTLKGVEKSISGVATLTYLVESEQTNQRAPGDLLGVQAKFNVKLSDFGVKNQVVGQKVAEIVEVSVNMVSSSASK
jgi:polyisoprenoid-binding protein YceI